MAKVLLLQQWYQASDPAMEEALWERLSFRRFVGLGLRRRARSLDDQPLPHAADGGGRGRAAVRGGGAATGRAGAAGDAGHAAGRDVGGRAGAPPAGRRRRRGQPQGPGPAWARRGPHARFGYKLHLGVDADSELIRRAMLTPANVNETEVADGLIAGDEGAVYGDAAYGTHARSTRCGRWGSRIG